MQAYKPQSPQHATPAQPRHCRTPRKYQRVRDVSPRAAQVADVGGGLMLRYLGGREELQLFVSECHSEQSTYFGGGFLTLSPGDTVLDVGANIGVFSLYASKCVGASGRVLSVEPFPEAAQAARANAESHLKWIQDQGPQVQQACQPLIINAAAGASDLESVELTAYSRAAGWSTLMPDDAEVLNNMRAYLDTLLSDQGRTDQTGMPESWLIGLGRRIRGIKFIRPVSKAIEELYVKSMLASKQTVQVPQVTLSGLMQEHGLSRIDLLKIDVERAELEVLAGIREEDWPKIRQITLEVHDVLGRIDTLKQMLQARGFQSVKAQQDERMVGTNLWMVYAKKDRESGGGAGGVLAQHLHSSYKLESRLAASNHLTSLSPACFNGGGRAVWNASLHTTQAQHSSRTAAAATQRTSGTQQTQRTSTTAAAATSTTAAAATQRTSGTQQTQSGLKELKSRYTASALAFLGDALWTMHVRCHYLLPPKHSVKYHGAVDKHSAAEMQALYFDHLMNSSSSSDATSEQQEIQRVTFVLAASEHAVVQWALAEPLSYRQRFQGSEEAQLAYRKATALEALIGFLSLTDEARLEQLITTLTAYLPEQ